MPEAADEIAASRLVLTALGVSEELGTAVPLRFETDTETITETFTLCGAWEGNMSAGAQMVWLSRAHADAVAPVRHGSSIGVNDGRSIGYVFAEFICRPTPGS